MRLARSVAAIAVALAVTTAGFGIEAGSAQAAPMPSSNGVSSAGVGAKTVPAKILPNSVHTHAQTAAGAAATLGSTNWSGYVALGDTYTSVTSNWIQPTLTCTTKGIVSFWVGLDGWNDGTVEQTGTGADCRTGSPQYYAWWETFPTNSQQTYAAVPVVPGDQISATVGFTGGQYSLTLTDSTQDWTRTTVADPPAGATNASAEVVAEAASLNNTVTQVADFGTASFTGSTINGQPLADAGASPIDMFNNSGSIIANTAALDADGDFAVTYTGGIAAHAAFQAADGTVHNYASGGDVPLKQVMMAGTSPSVAPIAGGMETAYQGTNGFLIVTGPSGTKNTFLGMMAGTSPSITALTGGGFMVAFQANTGSLWTYTSSSGAANNLALGMNPDSSPSITQLASGSSEIAFEANTSALWVYAGSTTAARSLKLGMASGTSPSLTALPTSGFMIAFQANTGILWTFTTSAGGSNRGLGMATGTSPSISTSGGGWGVAFQANTGMLWTVTSAAVAGRNLSRTMAAGTSPAIVGVAGGYETAYQADTGAFLVTGAAGDVDPQQPALPGTSPDIAP
ncbi:MAG TPA: G1 family glutamic endopeptidase [Pseudonocardiaceae bacterium]|nr:G1 family glutamic endopeptidase [Pseudonocardiaceae bacterium]